MVIRHLNICVLFADKYMHTSILVFFRVVNRSNKITPLLSFSGDKWVLIGLLFVHVHTTTSFTYVRYSFLMLVLRRANVCHNICLNETRERSMDIL